MKFVAEIQLPLRVRQSKKKWFYLNLNQYRNAHYYTLNTTKVRFKEELKSVIAELPELNRAYFIYLLYPGTKRRLDTSNICSIVDKYFSDAVVEYGKLPDDNYLFLPAVSYSFKGVDKNNPRVVVQIYKLNKSEEVI